MAVAEAAPRNHLLHILGVAFGIAVALGSMIGSGILRAPAAVAHDVPSIGIILLLWALGAVHAALAANPYAELGASVPKAGGPYVFTHRAMGDIPGLVVGWSTWAATVAGTASASVLFADFLSVALPAAAPFKAGISTALQIVLYGANIMGLREGRVLQETTSFAKGALLLLFAALAIFAVPSAANAVMPSTETAATLFAAVNAYKLIRGAYAGWDAPVYFSEENTTPGDNIPRSIFIGLGITAFLYLVVNASLLLPLGPQALGQSKLPFADVLGGAFGGATSAVVALVAMVIVTSCANANIMIAPRTIFALARDHLLPHQLAAINKGGSPYWAYVLSGIVSIALAATGQFVLVFGLIGTLDTMTGLLTNISYFILRVREPDLPRPFKAIGYPYLPALAIAVDAVLMVLFNSADKTGAIAAVAMIALCVPFAWIAHRARRAG